ncbi:2-hydroxyacid dehydrogenase [Glacieibacterium frigidum]|uniref:D-glycerate dehydrogenase n=1 Tax=Glacieibacterium frigidum TaxID=2593303 RepID=A0A552U8S6_9SPHN|nr:D-glycerate dehydrogenase [Glacieibacterium frigidum]TRW14626.1 D-glycerate dehydrogenase [Glacieibacterium frigidum]
MPSRPVVRVTRRLPPAVEARMAELFDVTLNADDVPLDAAALCAGVAAATVLVPTVTDEIDAAVIAAAGPQLRLIANFGAGVDHIDLPAARARGIVVTNTPGVLTDDTAEMVFALILAVSRRTGEGEKLLRAGGWTGWAPTGMLGHRVRGKALGIVGMGRIGQAVAVRARAFGMAVHYHNRHRLPLGVEQELGATWAPDLHAMLGAVDIVSLNCPHTPATHHLIDAAALSRMKPDAYLINCARGDIVDEAALAAALASGKLAGAGLDVYAEEPRITPALLNLPGVVLLPHMGSATFEGRQAMGDKVIANIRAWSDGHRPPDQVLEGWV